jgi:hypothetical protein
MSRVSLWDITKHQLEQISAAMQQPFPAPTYLALAAPFLSNDGTALTIPESFLGGSAPCLDYLLLSSIPLQGLLKLLSSANGLVDLSLLNIPYSVRIPSNAMTTCLSAMTKLQRLHLSDRYCNTVNPRRSVTILQSSFASTFYSSRIGHSFERCTGL